jgi:alpha-tubulin suppressor-like RCC1 family protein
LGAATITANSEGVSVSAEITVASLMPIASVSAAFYHTCAVTPGGTAYCWGSNSSGALGDGTRDDSSMPVSVSGGLSFASITTGEHHTCGVTTADVAYCWGRNLFGQIGDGTTIDTTMPVQVADGLAFRSLSAGEDHTCGLATSGLVYCWGRNHAGQLGSDSSPDTCGDSREPCSTRPVPVSGGLTFAAVSAFSHGHSCGIDTGGEAYCWGYNSDGQLGDGSTEASPIPIPVAGGLNFEATAVGFLHTCGATSNGTAYCWGMNWYGELGDGTAERHNRLTPTPVVGDRAFASISAGAYHTCGLTTDGRAYCWGQNEAGQLGNGRTEDSAIPVPVAGGLTFESVSAGWLRSCGVTALGALYCWGNGRATPAFVRFAP